MEHVFGCTVVLNGGCRQWEDGVRWSMSSSAGWCRMRVPCQGMVSNEVHCWMGDAVSKGMLLDVGRC